MNTPNAIGVAAEDDVRSPARVAFDTARRGDPRGDQVPPALHLLNLTAAWVARERRYMAEEMYRWQARALIRGSMARRAAGEQARAQGAFWAAEYSTATTVHGTAA